MHLFVRLSHGFHGIKISRKGLQSVLFLNSDCQLSFLEPMFIQKGNTISG